jgi:phage shock protein A
MPGIIERIKTILRANINDLISKAEDPEKILNQLIMDMQDSYSQAREQVKVSIADEKMLEMKYQEVSQKVDHYKSAAEAALKRGDEDLARAALARKVESEQLANEYKLQLDKQSQAVEVLKMGLEALDKKIDEAKRKKDLLIARAQRAEAAETINKTLEQVTVDTGPFEAFERMSDKVESIEASADASKEMAELDMKKASLEEELEGAGNVDVDSELAALKSEMGLTSLPPEKKPDEQPPAKGK